MPVSILHYTGQTQRIKMKRKYNTDRGENPTKSHCIHLIIGRNRKYEILAVSVEENLVKIVTLRR